MVVPLAVFFNSLASTRELRTLRLNPYCDAQKKICLADGGLWKLGRALGSAYLGHLNTVGIMLHQHRIRSSDALRHLTRETHNCQ